MESGYLFPDMEIYGYESLKFLKSLQIRVLTLMLSDGRRVKS